MHQEIVGELHRQVANGRYGPATVLELKGRVPLAVVPDVIIDWDLVITRVL